MNDQHGDEITRLTNRITKLESTLKRTTSVSMAYGSVRYGVLLCGVSITEDGRGWRLICHGSEHRDVLAELYADQKAPVVDARGSCMLSRT